MDKHFLEWKYVILDGRLSFESYWSFLFSWLENSKIITAKYYFLMSSRSVLQQHMETWNPLLKEFLRSIFPLKHCFQNTLQIKIFRQNNLNFNKVIILSIHTSSGQLSISKWFIFLATMAIFSPCNNWWW